MEAIFNKYDTDKNAAHHNYTKYYDRYFDPYTKKPDISYLEIGVFKGASLQAFREYLPLAQKIVGIDIDTSAKQYEDLSRNIYVEIGSQTDADFLTQVNNKHGAFDIILDDGSHKHDDIVATFKTLFPLLKNGGMYVVEDTICIRDNLHFFHGLTKYLHKWRADYGGGDCCVDPQKINMKSQDPFEYSIGDIVFTNSAIIIYKDVKHHWVL